MVSLVFTGEILSELLEHKLSKQEKESYMYLGALMALFDVIIDDFKMENSIALALFRRAFTGEDKPGLDIESAVEKIYDLYLQKLRETVAKDRWPEILKQIDLIRYQLNSGQQFMTTIGEDTVKSITSGKGGASMLLTAALLPVSTDPYKKCMMELGGFIQMMNDCQDMHKDTLKGITTFVHFCKSFGEIEEKLDMQRRVAFGEIKSLKLPGEGKYRTVFAFYGMYVVILYKLRRYAEGCENKLDFGEIMGMDKKKFRIDPFSVGGVRWCFGKILDFDYEEWEYLS
jgi:hypothetical protein